MSSFNCSICNAQHVDTRRGYISGCICRSLRKCDACGEPFVEVDGKPGQLACPSCWRVVMGDGYFTCPKCESHYFGRDTAKRGGEVVVLKTIRCHGSSSGPLFFGDHRGMCDWRGVWPPEKPADAPT